MGKSKIEFIAEVEEITFGELKHRDVFIDSSLDDRFCMYFNVKVWNYEMKNIPKEDIQLRHADDFPVIRVLGIEQLKAVKHG